VPSRQGAGPATPDSDCPKHREEQLVTIPRPAGRRTAALAVGLCLVLATGLTSCTSHKTTASPPPASPSATEPPLGFRSPPAFLPSAAPVDQVVTASAAHPHLAAQGLPVQVDLPTAQVVATITGPQVPPFVAPPPPAVTATFEVTLAHVVGTVPVRLSDFTITDQLGRTFHPTLVQRETPPPATISAGTTTFQVTAVMLTGEGRIYWAPTGGSPFVGWDFIVEND
jgi:hypothetical protein